MVDASTIIAGIKQFGLAPDGSDLRDLEVGLETLRRENAELRAERDSLLKGHRSLNIAGSRLEDRAEDLSRQLAEADKYRVMLLDLLAVIHRDGGHKTQGIGLELAHEQAIKLSSERIGQLDEARAEVARMHRRAQASEGLLSKAAATASEQIDLLASIAKKAGHWPAGSHWAKRAMEHWRDAARAALSGSGVGGWRSMESAPKDGAEFQAWIDGCGWEPRCRISPDTEAFEIWGRTDYDVDGWDTYAHLTPTHWMPLPAAPAPAGGE